MPVLERLTFAIARLLIYYGFFWIVAYGFEIFDSSMGFTPWQGMVVICLLDSIFSEKK